VNRRVIIVTAPKAGTGFGREQIPRLISELNNRGILVNCTDSILELRHQIGDAVSQTAVDDLTVVPAGGDGTLALICANVPKGTPIVPMPLGTENLLARYYGYSHLADRVVATILNGRSTYIDAGLANGRLFLVVASAGFDAEVVRGMHLTRRGHIRRIQYVSQILRALRRYSFPTINIEMDGVALASGVMRWAMLFNIPRYAASLKIEPEAIPNDGQLNLIGMRNGSVWSGLKYATGVYGGFHKRFKDVQCNSGATFSISSAGRVPYQLDGDYVGQLPMRIETLQDRVRLRIPG
jgi:diacylglycerol kinase family enzyme